MVGKSKMDRRGSGPVWFVMLVVLIFALFSITVAIATIDKCDDLGRRWNVFPPRWECIGDPNFG
jgi:hypothetical protein